jgi:hypothetical protein
MKRLPFGLRVAAGLTITAAEGAKDLPAKLAGFPITVVSEALQLSMRLQQQLTELAIKGDEALSGLRPVEQAPSWATFDEDLLDAELTDSDLLDPKWDENETDYGDLIDLSSARSRSTVDPWLQEQRALAEEHEPGEFDTPATVEPPPAFPSYPELSLAQLRARLRRFSETELNELLAYERATQARQDFVRMLVNRIETVRAAQ